MGTGSGVGTIGIDKCSGMIDTEIVSGIESSCVTGLGDISKINDSDPNVTIGSSITSRKILYG
jgi:hypothetical protein